MKITKIVITGGPCAGKTTGLSYIEHELSKIGYKVVFLNESATEIILSGLNRGAFENNYDFEKNIISLQLAKEKLYEEYCQNLPDENVVLICDRGIMDCKSYMSDEEFKRILKEFNLEEVQLRDTYDAVFHLTTAAKGAEKAYTTSNNRARFETLEQAIKSDDNTIHSWTGHPHLRVIDNSTSFEDKLKRLVKEILMFLGFPSALEIERKFLIKKPDLEFLDTLPNCKKVEIIQTYLNSNKNEEVRVRQRGKMGSYIYTLTTKKNISNTTREEVEKRITEKEYLNLLSNANTSLHQIKKTRYCIMHNNIYYEIDVYPFSNDVAICEVELSNENDSIPFPDYIEIIKEVTNDKRFSNYNISKSIPKEFLNN